MTRTRIRVLAGTAVLAAAGLGAGAAIAVGGPSGEGMLGGSSYGWAISLAGY